MLFYMKYGRTQLNILVNPTHGECKRKICFAAALEVIYSVSEYA